MGGEGPTECLGLTRALSVPSCLPYPLPRTNHRLQTIATNSSLLVAWMAPMSCNERDLPRLLLPSSV